MIATCKAVLLALALLTSIPHIVGAQTTTAEALVRRVDSLERRIAELERRLAQSEGVSGRANTSADAATANWRDIANWRRLREGMSYEAVRRILGEPDRIAGGTLAFWNYPNGGQVSFSSGRLRSWNEPPR